MLKIYMYILTNILDRILINIGLPKYITSAIFKKSKKRKKINMKHKGKILSKMRYKLIKKLKIKHYITYLK